MGQAILILLVVAVLFWTFVGAAIVAGALGFIAIGVVGLITYGLLGLFQMEDEPRFFLSAVVGCVAGGIWIYSQVGGWGLLGVVACMIFVAAKTSG